MSDLRGARAAAGGGADGRRRTGLNRAERCAAGSRALSPAAERTPGGSSRAWRARGARRVRARPSDVASAARPRRPRPGEPGIARRPGPAALMPHAPPHRARAGTRPCVGRCRHGRRVWRRNAPQPHNRPGPHWPPHGHDGRGQRPATGSGRGHPASRPAGPPAPPPGVRSHWAMSSFLRRSARCRGRSPESSRPTGSRVGTARSTRHRGRGAAASPHRAAS